MSNAEIDVSFCIPVYNAKAYVGKCIGSILDQGLERFEIICVDDHSTDGTYEELLRLAEIHPEIRVLQTEKNSGYCCVPRNTALRNARGRYVWFVDQDDLLVSGTGALYLRIADEHNAEAVMGRNYSFPDGKEPQVPPASDEVCRMDFTDPRRFYRQDQYGIYSDGVWLGMYSREFLSQHDLWFHEDMQMYEDYVFCYETGVHATNFVGVDHFGYLYRLVGSSLSHRKTQQKFLRSYRGARRALEIISGYRAKCGPELEMTTDAHIQLCKESVCIHLVRITDRKYVKQELRELREKGIHPYRTDPKLAYQKLPPRTAFVMHSVLPGRIGFNLVNLAFRLKDKLQRSEA